MLTPPSSSTSACSKTRAIERSHPGSSFPRHPHSQPPTLQYPVPIRILSIIHHSGSFPRACFSLHALKAQFILLRSSTAERLRNQYSAANIALLKNSFALALYHKTASGNTRQAEFPSQLDGDGVLPRGDDAENHRIRVCVYGKTLRPQNTYKQNLIEINNLISIIQPFFFGRLHNFLGCKYSTAILGRS